MGAIRFYGEARPTELALSASFRPWFTLREAQEDPDGEFDVQIQNGRVLVRVDCNAADSADPFGFYIPALRAAQLLADVEGFLRGTPFTVVLDHVETSDGDLRPAFLGHLDLAKICSAAGLADVESIFDQALNDNALTQTLSDALKMLHTLDYAPVAAGRIADSLARLVAGERGADAWSRLHEALRVTRSYVEPLSDLSKPARHGHRVYVPADQVHMLAERSWTLLTRYLVWRLNERLDEARFTVLAG